MSQVHKENLSAVDNALPNRAGLDIEIFGMEGIPEDIVQAHTQRVLQNFHQAEAERRQASGNQGSGGAGGQTKKPKFESPAELKKRLAEHKAAKIAAEANGGSSGSATPLGVGQAPPQAPPVQGKSGMVSRLRQIQQHFYSPIPQGASPPPPTYTQSYPGTQSQPTYAAPVSHAAPVSQPPYGGPTQQNQYGPAPPQQHGYGPPQFNGPHSNGPYNPQQPFAQTPAPVQYQQPTFQQPYQQPPYQQAPYQAPQPVFSPPPYQSQSPYPPQPYSPAQPYMQNGPPQFQGPTGGPPRQFGAGSPVGHFQQQNNFQPRNASPQQNGFPHRTPSGSLPPAQGLPQRPAFQAPPVNAFQFQQMHQGQLPGGQNASPVQQSHAQQNIQAFNNNAQQPPPAASTVPIPEATQESANGQSLDDLISEAKEAESSKPTKAADILDVPKVEPNAKNKPVFAKEEAKPEVKVEEKLDGKKDKDKSKVTKLVYDDNEISPEEKMAKMARYAYIPDRNAIRV